jgi:phosphate/sulfate permease
MRSIWEAGTAVAATVGKGIVDPSAMTLPAIAAAMLSIIAWGGIAARLGIPVSKSHALLAGLAGAGLAGGGWTALQWEGWQKVGAGLIASLGFGFAGALLLGKLIILLTGRTRPTQARLAFSRLQLVSAAFMAFNHGLNDGQEFMGVFALTMSAGGATTVFECVHRTSDGACCDASCWRGALHSRSAPCSRSWPLSLPTAGFRSVSVASKKRFSQSANTCKI